MYISLSRPHPFSLQSFRIVALLMVVALMLSSIPLGVNNTTIPSLVNPTGSTDVAPAHASASLPVAGEEAADMQFPVTFVPNVGQTNPEVAFQSHVLGGKVFFTEQEMVYALPGIDASPAVLRMQFQGASSNATVVGGEELAGKVNYLLGGNPDLWQRNVATYSGVTYQNLYPGISLTYDGGKGTLKGTYTVAAGANPNLIKWNYAGATSLQINRSTGNLVVGVAGGQTPLVETAPVAWQTINGTRVPVQAGYVVNNGTVGFELGAYNPAYPLTIDPAVIYSTYLGGTGSDGSNDMVVDQEQGIVYVVGETDSSDFPTENPIDPDGGYGTRKEGKDVFVTAINVQTNELIYSTYLGGSGTDVGMGIAIDYMGYTYVTGHTDSDFDSTQDPLTSSFPISPTKLVTGEPEKTSLAYQIRNAGGTDAFVAKIAPNGSNLEYSTFLGGSGSDEGYDISIYTGEDKLNLGGGAVYDDKNYSFAYIVGKTDSTDLAQPSKGKPSDVSPPDGTFNAVQPTYGGGTSDAFFAKIGPYGRMVQSLSYFGGSDADEAHGVVVDSSTGLPYIVGLTRSSNITPTTNAPQKTHGGGSDAFIYLANYDPDSGVAMTSTFSTFLGGSGDDEGHAIALDAEDNIYVTGSAAANFPTESAINANGYDGSSYKGGTSDAFVAKIAKDKSIAYSSYLGGSVDDTGNAITLDGEGNVYVVGTTGSGNFPTYLNPPQASRGSGTDAFISVLKPDGTSFFYSSYLGGGGSDTGEGAAVYGSGEQGYAFLTGQTNSTGSTTDFDGNFPIVDPLPNQGALQSTDAFITKIGAPAFSLTRADSPNDPFAPMYAAESQPNPAPAFFSTMAVDNVLDVQLQLEVETSTDFVVSYETFDCGPTDQRATADEDYTAVNGSKLIEVGTTSATIPVTITADTKDEPDEMFCMQLTTGIGEVRGFMVYIVDNNGPEVSFSAPTQLNITEGSTVPVSGTVGLNQTSPQTITVAFGINAGATTAANTDYTVQTGSPITFMPGQNTAEPTSEIGILAAEDDIRERAETVVLQLSQIGNPEQLPTTTGGTISRATIGDTNLITATIVDTDDPIKVSFAQTSTEYTNLHKTIRDKEEVTIPLFVEGQAAEEVQFKVDVTSTNATTATHYYVPNDTVTIPALTTGSGQVNFTVVVSGFEDIEPALNFSLDDSITDSYMATKGITTTSMLSVTQEGGITPPPTSEGDLFLPTIMK